MKVRVTLGQVGIDKTFLSLINLDLIANLPNRLTIIRFPKFKS